MIPAAAAAIAILYDWRLGLVLWVLALGVGLVLRLYKRGDTP